MTFGLQWKRKTTNCDNFDWKRKTPSAEGKRTKADEELLELFRDELERSSSRFWPLLSALRHCCQWGQTVPAWLEQALTDPKEPYQIGCRDGYEQAKRQIRDETYLAVARIEAKTADMHAEPCHRSPMKAQRPKL